MEVEEPWEALDTDDTDLSTSTSLLRRCTNQPRLTLLPSHPSSSPPLSQQQPPSTITTLSRRSLIPGPAGAIQAAMHRNNPLRCNANQPPDISTQEYIRRVEEDSGEEFSRNPWVFALDILRNDGSVDTTPLSAIKKCVSSDRFNEVVAIVKSCAPNGLGDMMITLKDPTGVISASVHGKVLSAGEFGRLITLGSVLILHKVVAFSSSCMSCYLNITRSNIAKVVSVDCEVQNFTEANIDSTPVFSRNIVMPEKNSTLVSKRTGVVVGDVQRSSCSKGKAVIIEPTETENYTQPGNLCSSRLVENAADRIFKEPIHPELVNSGQSAFGCYNQRQGGNSRRTSQAGSGSLEGMVRNLQDLKNVEKPRQVKELSSAPGMVENMGNWNWQANNAEDKRMLRGSNYNISTNQAKRDMSEIIGGLKSIQQTETGANSMVVEKQDDQEPRGSNGVKKQRVALISRTSVQEWTDEQLCILDMDDD